MEEKKINKITTVSCMTVPGVLWFSRLIFCEKKFAHVLSTLQLNMLLSSGRLPSFVEVFVI